MVKTSSISPIDLGPFKLHQCIGVGAMGRVWSGIHPIQQVPVAIKVLSGRQARSQKYQDAFRFEVQAVASLEHPNIITVLDYGLIPQESETLSNKRLIAGCPYLVMELASQGSLDTVERPMPWDALLDLLIKLLDALAHAHARGVIHRDIKPANVLLSGQDDIRPGLKLSDFGIVHAMDSTRDRILGDSLGTPSYMAPELFEGRWRDYGPWTDLYAVGCMAYQLASGHLPFQAKTLLMLAQKHMYEKPPPLPSSCSVPDGFAEWLQSLLCKRPRDRFQRAADAAWALEQLTDVIHAPVTPPAPHSSLLTTGLEDTLVGTDEISRVQIFDPGDTLAWEPSHTNPNVAASIELQAALHKPPTASSTTPPIPTTWRRSVPPSPSMQLIGAGLGIYDLKTLPLVGREAERDVLWNLLRKANTDNTPQLIVLQGTAGVGKSRLVEWIGQRAHELGAATLLRANHSPIETPASGIPRMIARHMMSVGISRDALHQRFKDFAHRHNVLQPYFWDAMTELLLPLDDDNSAERITFSNPTQRHAIVLRFIQLLSQERPILVWLDDVQWGSDSIAFAKHILDVRNQAGPILLVLTTRDEALAERPIEAEQLRRLLQRPNTNNVSISPLDRRECQALIRELLGLDDELGRQLEERCGGNPLFAVQLVKNWVGRGILDVGQDGFFLKTDAEAVLPDDIHQVWSHRIERLLEDHSFDTRVALEIAACLGQEVNSDEWRDACSHASITIPKDLLQVLFAFRLAHRHQQGWSFAHGMLRESIERAALEAERLSTHHRACAAMLSMTHRRAKPGVAERLGRHLFSAGDLHDAIAPLIEGATKRNAASQYDVCFELLQLREQALEALAVPESDPRYGEGWLIAIDAHRMRNLDVAMSLAERTVQSTRTHGWSFLPEALNSLAQVLARKGRLHDAIATYQEAIALQSNIDLKQRARSFFGLGYAAQQLGELDNAVEYFQKAQALFSNINIRTGIVHCLQGLGRVAKRRENYDAAADYLQRALELTHFTHSRLATAACLNSLADIERFRGNLEGAEDGYQKALLIYNEIGAIDVTIPRLNLGLVRLRRARYQQARSSFLVCQDNFERKGQKAMLGFVDVGLIACCASEGDWDGWEHHMKRLTSLLNDTTLVDPDIAWPASLAADIAFGAHQYVRAQHAYLLARSQWLALGQDVRLKEIEKALDRLSTLT